MKIRVTSMENKFKKKFCKEDDNTNSCSFLVRKNRALFTPCPKKTTSVITVQRNFRRQFEVDPPILNLCKVEKKL